MSLQEVTWRARDEALRLTWIRRQVRPGQSVPPLETGLTPTFPVVLRRSARAAIPGSARRALVAEADGLLNGQWEILGVTRSDLVDPDWFYDPLTCRRASQSQYAFRINHRSEAETGNVKQLWELSRHHHLTVLAAAWFLTGDDRYAHLAAQHLRSWWEANPFLSGVHWTNGIEVALRLISWTWVRRLLDDWPGVLDLFERNELAVRQLFWHQEFLATFRSRGSSANNHAIAEAAGQVVASCAFPWFAQSTKWRMNAQRRLDQELAANTFESGINRELAFDYQAFVAELALVAAVESQAAGQPLPPSSDRQIARMVDAIAAVLDQQRRAPRQGDGDNGRAFLLDATDDSRRWSSLLALGAEVIEPMPWWPVPTPGVGSTLLGALSRRRIEVPERASVRRCHFGDAGLTVLRTDPDRGPEIWCRCDGGPHGYLSIGAHAHADALSVELRHGGVDILADPGTYCYHGEPDWRTYFRSTLAHNTVQLAGRNQSEIGGPFMWMRAADTRVLAVAESWDGVESWCAEHDGYEALDPPAMHRRTVRLDRNARRLDVLDELRTSGGHSIELVFHLGPTIEVEMTGFLAHLSWSGPGGPASASFALPESLDWSEHRGEQDPILGWYSREFGVKEPTTTLVGAGVCGADTVSLLSTLSFDS
jgi:hypothetical protein